MIRALAIPAPRDSSGGESLSALDALDSLRELSDVQGHPFVAIHRDAGRDSHLPSFPRGFIAALELAGDHAAGGSGRMVEVREAKRPQFGVVREQPPIDQAQVALDLCWATENGGPPNLQQACIGAVEALEVRELFGAFPLALLETAYGITRLQDRANS